MWKRRELSRIFEALHGDMLNILKGAVCRTESGQLGEEPPSVATYRSVSRDEPSKTAKQVYIVGSQVIELATFGSPQLRLHRSMSNLELDSSCMKKR